MEIISVSDEALLESLKQGYLGERKEQVLFLIRLAEADRRGLWKKTSKNLNEFCRKEIGLSESTAWKRIQVSHLGVRIPYALELLGENKISMTNLSILSPCLKGENAKSILEEASGKGRYAVEAIKARYIPKEEPRDSIVPIAVKEVAPLLKIDAAPSPAKVNPSEPSNLTPLELPMEKTVRVQITFVADDSLVQSMNKVKSLLSHKFPNPRLEEIEAEVYRFYLEKHDPERRIPKPVTKLHGKPRPASHSRYIRRDVDREVWQRDQGRCAYLYEDGTRCNSTYALQIDHAYLFSEGGRSDDAKYLRLLCRSHNLLEAEKKLGKKLMSRFKSPGPFRKKDGSGLKDFEKSIYSMPETFPSGLIT